MREIYYIAEIGQNHNGSLETAKYMVDLLVGSGVKAIKTAKRDVSIYKDTPYINEHSYGKTYREHREALELSEYDFIELKKYVEKSGFDFISSFTDIKSLNFLNEIGVQTLKLASCVNNNVEILKRLREIKKPVIASTGMSNRLDVAEMVSNLRGLDFSLLQCTSAYPCKMRDVNLGVMEWLRNFSNKVGISNHTVFNEVDLFAYIHGADIIERHFTFDTHSKGTDHIISADTLDIITFFSNKDIYDTVMNDKKTVLECEKPAIEKLRGALI